MLNAESGLQAIYTYQTVYFSLRKNETVSIDTFEPTFECKMQHVQYIVCTMLLGISMQMFAMA